MAPSVPPVGNTHPIKMEWTDEAGDRILLEGALPLVMATDAYKVPNQETGAQLDTKWLSDWLEETGLGSMGTTEPAPLLQKCKAVWIGSNYLVPRLALSDDRLKAFSLYIIFLAVASDLPELKTMKGGGASGKMSQMLGKVVGDIIANKYKSMEDLPDVPDRMVPIIRALYLASRQSRADIPNFEEECGWVVESMNKTLTAMPLLGNSFLDETPETFKYLKRFAGSEPLIELAALANGITLPVSMRSHLLFQQIMAKASALVTATSDVKTLPLGPNPINTVTYWARQDGKTIQEGFMRTLEDLEKDAYEFRLLCFSMRNMNKKNSRLERFLKHIEEFIDGNTYRAYH